MTAAELPLFGLVLVLATIAVSIAARLTPPRVTTADRPVCGDEPTDLAWCGSCVNTRLCALHDDGTHTCLTCLTTTAGGQ